MRGPYDGSRSVSITLRYDGLWEARYRHLVPGGRLYQPLEPEQSGDRATLGPDWREALGSVVTEVLVIRVPGA